MFKTVHLLGFLFLLHYTASGQDLQLSFHHLSQEDGLGAAEDYFVFQDTEGFIWISTAEGLNRYDGKNIVKFSSSDSQPNALTENQLSSRCFEDNNHDLWFSSFSAVNCWRRKTGRFETWSLPGSSLKYYHAFHFSDDGHLWLRIGSSADALLYLFDTANKSFQQRFPMEGNRCAVVQDVNGRPAYLLETQLPTRTGFVWRDILTGKGEHAELSLQENGKPRAFNSPTHGSLWEGDSLVWMGVYDGLGVYYPKTGKHVVLNKKAPGILPDIGWVTDMAPLDPYRLLVTCSYGLAVFDKRQKAFVQLLQASETDQYSLKKDAYKTLYLDSFGDIWASSTNYGVSFASLHKRKFPANALLNGQIISSMYLDSDQRIWCSTLTDGAYIFQPGKQPTIHLPFLHNLVYADKKYPIIPLAYMFKDTSGTLWGGQDNTLIRWDNKASNFIFQENYFLDVVSSDANRLNYFLQLQSGEVIAAKGKIVYRVSTSPVTVSLQAWHDLSPYKLQIITALFQDKKGRYYIADQTEKLLIFTELNGKLALLKELKEVGACNSFFEMGDSILLSGTSKGLLRIDAINLSARLFSEQSDGLPTEPFFNALVDKKGFIWLSGNNGLLRYNPGAKQFQRFNKADGLASLSAIPAAFLADASGEFWLGSKNGLNIFRPESVELLHTKPPVHIIQVLVNDQAISIEKLAAPDPMALDYQSNTLAFQFAVLDYSDPGSNQFYYRLHDVENQWVSNGNSNMVRYPNLPPGHYTFEVKASNSDGIFSDNTRSFSFVIRPPFWQTWWFYLLCTLSLAGLIYGWFQYRLRQALKIERLRVQISSDLHDDVGTLLAGLAMQSEALELTAQEKDKSKLQRISEISRNAMAHMRDTVWAIDARKDKLENLLDRLREHAEETLTPRDIRFEIQTDNLSPKQNLSTFIRQNLYLICKEAITNAAKHTNGNQVTIGLKKSAEGFEMRIADNGSATEKAYKTTGLGTSNMQMRAEKMGGKLEISRENGFSVTFRMKGLS